MGTFGPSTASLTILGRSVKDYLRDCLIDPRKLAELFTTDYEIVSDENTILLKLPDLDKFWRVDMVQTLLKALREEGFSIQYREGMTYITLPSQVPVPFVGFPSAKESAGMSKDAVKKLIDKSLMSIETSILQATADSRFQVLHTGLAECHVDVVRGVIAFLEDREYRVWPEYKSVTDDFNESYLEVVGYVISWAPVPESFSFWKKLFRRKQ